MREIKFRAWEKDRKKMSSPLEPLCFTNDDLGGTGWWWGNCIFMQYTGLNDKNGKEIYEGDIVRGDTYGSVEVVQFEVGVDGDGFYSAGYCLNDFRQENVEVIGNIYENPELLEKIK